MAFNPLKIFQDGEQKDASPAPVKEHLVEELKPKAAPLRGPGGKFISKKASSSKTAPAKGKKKKKTTKKPSVETKEVATVSFYGIDIRRIYHDKKWYFSTDDIMLLAKPIILGGKITKKKNYKKVFDEIAETISGVSYADADGTVKLIQAMEATFPGPLVRHLHGSLQVSNPLEKIEPAETELKEPAAPSNPSDRVG